MTRNDLIVWYHQGRLSRRNFIRGMMGLGLSASAAVALADKVRAMPSRVYSSNLAALQDDVYGGDDVYDVVDDELPGDDIYDDDDDGDDNGGGDDDGDDDDDDATGGVGDGEDDDGQDDDDEVNSTTTLPNTGSGGDRSRLPMTHALLGIGAAATAFATRLRQRAEGRSASE